MKTMQAAFYARVSSEQQAAAHTIESQIAALNDEPGLGLAIAQAIAGAGINMTFFVAQAVGRRFSAVLGFESEAGAKTVAPLTKKAATKKK